MGNKYNIAIAIIITVVSVAFMGYEKSYENIDIEDEFTYLEKGKVVLEKKKDGRWFTSSDTPLISSNIRGLCVDSKSTNEVTFNWCGELKDSKTDFLKEGITHIEFILKSYKFDENHQVTSMDLEF